jgi:hypothetical protein
VGTLTGEIGQRYAVALDALAILVMASLVGALVLAGRDPSDTGTAPRGQRKSQRPRRRSA